MEPTLQDLADVYTVMNEKYAKLDLHYGVIIDNDADNIHFLIPHHYIIKMSLLPTEIYRCVVDFYIKKWEFIEGRIEIWQTINGDFQIYLKSYDRMELRKSSLIDKILVNEICDYIADTTANSVGTFTTDACKSMKELLHSKQPMIEELAQRIIDYCFHYKRIFNCYHSIQFCGNLKLLPTAFTTDEDTYLSIICGDEENDNYMVGTTEGNCSNDKEVSYTDVKGIFEDAAKFIKEKYEAAYKGDKNIHIEMDTKSIQISIGSSYVNQIAFIFDM